LPRSCTVVVPDLNWSTFSLPTTAPPPRTTEERQHQLDLTAEPITHAYGQT
jgi:hypothetical protein